MKKQDIWNPWHGCIKKSEGCANCYIYISSTGSMALMAERYIARRTLIIPSKGRGMVPINYLPDPL